MNIEDLKNEISITSAALTNQIERLLEFEDKIPQIEFDIVLGNVRKLYEDLLGLQKMNKQLRSEKPSYTPKSTFVHTEVNKKVEDESLERTDTEQQATSETKADPIPKEVSGPIPEVKSETLKTETEIKKEEKTIEEKPRELTETEKKLLQDEPLIEEPPKFGRPLMEKKQKDEKLVEEEKEEISQPKSVLKEEAAISDNNNNLKDTKRTIDLYPDDKTTLADKFMDSEEKTLADKMQRNKIEDLKNAIDINQKFLFIRELFAGNNEAYSEAIIKLNSCTKLDEALDYMAELTNKYNWDLDNEAVNHLIRFIQRRY